MPHFPCLSNLIETMKTIKETTRKKVRYLLFTKKRGTSPANPVVGEVEDKEIIEYFETHENFTSWEGFETLWDIGMGNDLTAKARRKNKWFLAEHEKYDIVLRPLDYWEKEAQRRGVTAQDVMKWECHERGISLKEFFELFFGDGELLSASTDSVEVKKEEEETTKKPKATKKAKKVSKKK